MQQRRRSGLGSLIPGADLTDDGIAEMAPLTVIAVNPYQPRKDFAPEALEELAESIRRYGILQPLAVRRRDGGFELIAGERRLQAARRAGLSEVPVIIRDCTDAEMLALALVENLQREDLNPVEAARSYQQLSTEFGFSQEQVAERVGKSRSAVANTMRLLALPDEVLGAIVQGTISEGHGRALLAAKDRLQQQALFRDAVENSLTVRELEARVNPTPVVKRERKKKSATRLDANLQQLQLDMQHALGTRVRFRPGATTVRGTVEIEYYSEEDLERINDVLQGNLLPA